MPGVTARSEWLSIAAEALDGERVGAVFGSVHRLYWRRPVRLWTRASARLPFSAVPRAPSYLLVRREVWAAHGGFDERAVACGGLAPVLDVVERLLEAGLIVAECDVRGPGLRGSEWERVRAQGALLAAVTSERGIGWVVRRAAIPTLLRARRRKRALASTAAMCAGAIRGARFRRSAH
jgi:hypothetical protein